MKVFISYQIQGALQIHSIIGQLHEFKWDVEGNIDIKDVLATLHDNHGCTYEVVSPTQIISSIVILSINFLPNISNKLK